MKRNKDIGVKSVKRAIALFFALLSMFTLLSPLTVHLNLFGAGFFYLGGLPLMWGIIPLLAVLSLIVFREGSFPRVLWRYIGGVVLLSLGISSLVSYFAFKGLSPFSFASYNALFYSFPSIGLLYLSSSLGGGLIGFILYSLLIPLSAPFLYLVSSLFLLAGLIVIFFPFLKRARQKIKTSLAIARSKKESEKERKRLEEEEERKRKRIEAIAPMDEEETLEVNSEETISQNEPRFAEINGLEEELSKENEPQNEEKQPLFEVSSSKMSVEGTTMSENTSAPIPLAADEKKEKPILTSIERKEETASFTPKRVDIYREEEGILPFAGTLDYVSAPLSSLIDVGPKEAVFVPEEALLDTIKSESQPPFHNNEETTFLNREEIETEPVSETKQEETEPSFHAPLFDNEVRESLDRDKGSEEKKMEIAPGNETKNELPSSSNEVFFEPVAIKEESAIRNEEKDEETIFLSPSLDEPVERKESPEPVKDEPEPQSKTESEPKPIIDSSLDFPIAPEQEETPDRKTEETPEREETEKIDKSIDPLTGEHFAAPSEEYHYPEESLLNEIGADEVYSKQEQDCNLKKEVINATLESFKAGAHVESYTIGPSVTRFNIATDSGITVSSVKRYIQSIQVKLGGIPTRYEEVVIGQMTSGLEIVNEEARTVYMKEIYRALPPLSPKTRLYVPFGEDISGKFISGDLSKFPHMLVSGGTGSGKSVYMHSVIMSLIMRNRPEELKLVMIDPKRVEMGCYSDIPHLLCPIVKDMSQAKVCVDKLCHEMERRYSLFEKTGTREINEYNNSYASEHGLMRLPFIVCIIDEFADLMDTFKNVEEPVVRIAQKARAAGIHLIIATQRPTVNVVTGRLKANLGVRVALSMNSSTDSVTILNQAGAEELAGHGDMLVICPEVLRNGLIRAQGAMVETNEIKRVTDFIKSERKPQYDPYFLDLTEKEEEAPAVMMTPKDRSELRQIASDDLYEIVKEKTMSQEYMSISRIQREFEVGFSRAGKLFKRLQEEGVVEMSNGPTNSKGSRVLLHAESKSSSLPSGSTDNSEFNGGENQ